ncbi:MAG: magnesium transporter MgtE N-terminal domain-containing protein [Thermodesulfobacteriota bacterium]
MRRAGHVPCILFILVFFASSVTAPLADTGQTTPPVKAAGTAQKPAGATGKHIDPDLESILAADRSQYEFLARLTPAEQKELARLIKKRVDEEAGVVVSIMAIASRIVPAILSAQFAKSMEPATVARISDKVSVKKAIAIADHLDADFLAEIAVYQDPKKVTAVVEGLPDKKLIDITEILFLRKEYRVVARFSDGLTPEKLKRVAEKINDPATLIEIARHMQNREKVATVAIGLSDDYLAKFMGLLSGGDDYQLAAAVGRGMNTDRQVRLLDRMEPEKAARLASFYPPETIARIMEKTDDDKLAAIARLLSPEIIARVMEKTDDDRVVAIARLLPPETMGHVSSALNAQSINRLMGLLSREQVLAALPHIDLAKFQGDWPDLTLETKNRLRSLGKDYPPLAEAIRAIE